jgi:hypothetical protein
MAPSTVQHWAANFGGGASSGHPALAAELARRDASLTHRRAGVYSSMFIVAAIAAAFVEQDPLRGKQVSQGNDTDSFSATSGAIRGIFFGPNFLPVKGLRPFNNEIRACLRLLPKPLPKTRDFGATTEKTPNLRKSPRSHFSHILTSFISHQGLKTGLASQEYHRVSSLLWLVQYSRVDNGAYGQPFFPPADGRR